MPSVVTLKAVIIADDTAFHATVQKDVQELGDLDKAADKAAGGVKRLGDSERAAKRDTDNLADSHKHLSAIGSIVSGVFQGMGQSVANYAMQAAKAAYSTLNAFADSASALNKQQQDNVAIFGKSAGAIDTWAKTASRSFGLSERAALAAAGTFGQTFHAIGVSSAPAASLSKNLVRLAADMAAFKGKTFEEAANAIRRGLTGSERGLQSFGVVISKNAILQEALRLGLVKNAKEMNQQATSLAVTNLLTKQTAAAQGEFAKTSGSLATATKTLAARYEDAGAAIGQFILPLKVQFMEAMLKAIDVLQSATPAIGKFITDATAGFGRLKSEALPILSNVWGGIKTGVADARAAWDSDFAGIRTSTQKAASAVWGFVQSYFGEVSAWFRDNMPLIRETVKNGLAAVQRFWDLYGANITQAVKALWGILTTAFTLGMRIVTGVVRLALLVINGHWEQAGQAIVKIAGDMIGGVVGVFNKGQDLTVAAFKGIVKGIWNLHQWSEDVAWDLGNAIIDGVIKGIVKGAGRVWDAIRNLLAHPTEANIGAAAKEAFAIASPAASFVASAASAPQSSTLATTTPASAAAAMVKGSGAAISDTVKKAQASIVGDGKALAGLLTSGIKLGTPGAIKAASEAGAAAGGHVKKKLTEAQQEWKAFADFAAEQRAALASAISGDDSASMQLAKRFRLVSAARREEIAGVMDKIKAITAEKEATKALADKVAALRHEILLARASTPTAKARLELGVPFGPLQKPQQQAVNDYVRMQPEKEAADAAASAYKGLTDQVERNRREMMAAQATREVDRVSWLNFGKPFKDLTTAGFRVAVAITAADNARKAFVAGIASSLGSLGESMAATFGGITDTLKPTTERLAGLNREILLSRQTTIEGIESVNLYGVAFENLSASVQGAIRNIAGLQRQQALSAGMDALGGLGAAYGAASTAVRKGQDQQAAEKAKQQRQFVEGLTNAALHYGRGFVEALLNGGGGVKKWFSNLVSSSIPAFADTVIERTIKPQLENIFSGMVKSVQGTLNITQQAVGQMVASVYSLFTLMGGQGKKKQGLGLIGGLLGGALGLAIGGPAGALTGFNVGTAAGAGYASGGIGGAVLGGGLSYVSSRGGPSAIFGSGASKTVSMETGSSSSLGSGNAGASLNAAMSRGERIGNGNYTGVNIQNMNVSKEVDMTTVANKLARVIKAQAG